jgi:hypothetical protein
MNRLWQIIFSTRFKTGVLLLSAVAVIGFFVAALYLFRPADNEPDVQLIDMEMRKEIRDFASVVRTGLYIKNFELFDITNDHFIAGLVIWFEFLTDEIMLDTIQNFSFINGKILEKSSGDIRVNKGSMLVKFDVRVEFKSQLNYYRYPFDDHRISLVLTNNGITPNELYFTVDNNSFAMASDVYTSNWQVLELDTAWGYTKLKLDARAENKKMLRPVVAYSINFAKSSMRQIIIIFVPLFIALLFGLLTFLMALSNAYDRMRMSVSALTALLSYRFIIDRMMPTVGYLTTTDLIYVLYLLLLLLIFVLQTMLGLYTEYGKGIPADSAVWLQKMHDIVYLIIAVVFVGYSGYVLLY